MTVLIKGMEMPEGCRDCELGGVYIHRDANDVCTEEKYRCSVTFYPLKDLTKRHEKCPLVEVPTPHGRLIDADDFDSRIRAAGGQADEELTDDFKDGVLSVLTLMKTQNTVIEAEEG